MRARVIGTPQVTESRREGGLAALQSTHGSFTAKPSNAIQRAQHETIQRTKVFNSKRSDACDRDDIHEAKIIVKTCLV